jgi:hypothetical protein
MKRIMAAAIAASVLGGCAFQPSGGLCYTEYIAKRPAELDKLSTEQWNLSYTTCRMMEVSMRQSARPSIDVYLH